MTRRYVEIAVNVPQVAGVFHYHLPEDLAMDVDMGHLVIVPFGKQKVYGVVLDILERPEVPETKPVLELVDPEVVLTQEQIAFARYLSVEYLTPLVNCIGLMLPSGLLQQADTVYTALGQIHDGVSVTQKRLWNLLKRRGPLRGSQIDRALRRINWRAGVPALVKHGYLTKYSVLPGPKVRPKQIRNVQLACPPQAVQGALAGIGQPGSNAAARRRAIMTFLMHEPGPVDVSWVYAQSGGHSGDLRTLAEHGLVVFGESEIWRDPLVEMDALPSEVPQLTREQQAVWDKFQTDLRAASSGKYVKPVLLHGVTGSGKTEIYLRAVGEVLRMGRQAIVLVPEISLTPQTVRRFINRFPGQVGLVHSGLSAGERYDTWRRARSGNLKVVVGPRSALFTPFSRIGLIVVDESHDDSYYQSEGAPHYHARKAALNYARLCAAVCLLGSATPDVTSIYQCRQGEWQYSKLPSRILGHQQVIQSQLSRIGASVSNYRTFEAQAVSAELPEVTVVDMRRELKSGNRSIFSRALQISLEKTLEKNQQAILFLNRRGTATYVFCRDCGYALKCPHCDVSLTYHHTRQILLCHHCGYKRKMPERCPVCGSERIRHYGTGTQRVESEIEKMFPQARTLRWDYETTRKKGAHYTIMSHFAAHRADILIGTQMLAKGLDLPLVTLVGVVLADVGLNLPDYRASERTFQVLTQVAGRAGRSPLGGEVILQTFQPEQYVIRAAAGHDYKAFFHQELAFRQKLGYPPFTRLVRLEYRNRDAARAERAAAETALRIQKWLAEERRRATRMIGPNPCYYGRVAGYYRWQIVLSGPDPASLFHNRKLPDWKIEVDPPSLL